MRRVGRLSLYLFLLFLAAGLLLVVTRVGLDRADRWIDGNAGLLDIVGSWLFRIVCGAIVALCAATVVGGLWTKLISPRGDMGDSADFVAGPVTDEGAVDAPAERPLGWGAIVVAAIIGYFAWFGVLG